MSPTQEKVAASAALPNENGDLYDEDTGQYFITLELENDAPPAQLSIWFNGFWYKYKIDSREAAEDAPSTAYLRAEVKDLASELDAEAAAKLPNHGDPTLP